MAKGKSSKSRKGRSSRGASMGMLELVAPAATALLAPFALTKIQKPEADKAKNADDKTWAIASAGAYFASKNRGMRKYAPSLLVFAAMSYRRGQALAGKLEEDPEKSYILSETAAE